MKDVNMPLIGLINMRISTDYVKKSLWSLVGMANVNVQVYTPWSYMMYLNKSWDISSAVV